MRVPQVNERVKEAPASALRAMFAGIGSLLAVTDKIRPKHAAPEAAAEPEVPATDATVVAEAPAAPVADTVAEPETIAAPETVAAPETLAAPETIAAPEAEPAALPIANYDELSIASLRARLRNLSVEQLAELVTYEKGHAAREDVVAMFERRIAKVESEA
jgi:hypothetical protein